MGQRFEGVFIHWLSHFNELAFETSVGMPLWYLMTYLRRGNGLFRSYLKGDKEVLVFSEAVYYYDESSVKSSRSS
jgi:hypothetical protein